MGVIFITGIDTETGKTMVTGLLARYLLKQNKSVITQKIVQTGCENISEDIITHRKIMGIDLIEEDKNGITCQYVFKYPASPKLAAKLELKSINTDIIHKNTEILSEKYDTVLLEGAGGVYVPLKNDLLVLDYIEMYNYPLIVVTTGKLGSINHTLLTLDAIARRDLKVNGVIFNNFIGQDRTIIDDTKDVIERFMSHQWFNASIIDVPPFNLDSIPDVDFSAIFRE